MGAGLSFLAQQEDGTAIPDTKALIDILLGQPTGTGSKHPLDRVAGKVLRDRGVEFLYNTCKKNFSVTSVDSKLKTLYAIPWKRIYTTNYDNSIELSRTGFAPISSITIDEPQANCKIGSIVHLNGFINRISPANVERGLLLSDSAYAASRLIETGWLSFFERDIGSSRAILFVGYSLSDFEIDQSLVGVDGLSKKAFFFISPTADEIDISTLQRYGTVVPGGIDRLLSAIGDVRASYTPPKFTGGFTYLRELTAPQTGEYETTAATAILQQLVYGKLPEREVMTAARAFDDQRYLVLREQDVAAQDAIKAGPWRDVVFVGEFASGKSASTLTLAAFLKGEGYRVFYALRGGSLSNDLRKLSGLSEKVAVIFDGYAPFRDQIAEYASNRGQNHRIILTERAAIHEMVGSFVEKTPHLGPVREVVLDKISARDTPAFEALTNFGGFWGDRAGAGVAFRQKFIEHDLEGSLYRLLVEIIKSEKVQSQLREILKPLSHDIAASKLFCSALIINRLGFNFTISEWQYLFDRQLVRRMLTSYAEQVRHFIMSDSNQIYVRNGILSSHILHAFLDDELVRNSLVNLYEGAERHSRESEIWRSIRVELTKFSSIEPMFSEPIQEVAIHR